MSATDEAIEYRGVTEATPPLEEGYSFKLTSFLKPIREADGVWAHRLNAGDGAFVAMAAQVPERPMAIIGSAVIVAPGVAVTAKHVLDEMMRIPNITGVLAIAMNADGTVTFWHATTYHPISDFDVVVMAIQPMTSLARLTKFMRPTIVARVPEVGERLSVLGFRAGLLQGPNTPGDLALFESVGSVTQVFARGRDRRMLPNPCVEVDLCVLGGMSGGPVFDEVGHLIGIASSGYDSEDGKPGFVSLIWPAIVWPLSPAWPPKLYAERMTPKEMASSGYSTVDIVGGNRVVMDGEPGGICTFELLPEQ